MFLKKKKGIQLANKGIVTNLIVNGKNISEYVMGFELEQEGGAKPKLTIKISPKYLDIVTEELKEIKIKTIK